MTEHMCRKLDILKTTSLLNALHNGMYTRRLKRFPTTNKKSSLIRVSRLTVLVNVLPKKLTHLRINAYLTLFTTLTHNLDISVIHIRNPQSTNLSYTNSSIQKKQQNHMIPKTFRSTRITHTKHPNNMFFSKSRTYTFRCLRMLQTGSRIRIYQLFLIAPT